MPRFIRSACLTNYVPVARSFGLDPYRCVKEAGLDRSCLMDPEIKVPVGDVWRLLEASARAARVEDFGLRMSEPRRLSELGPLALAIRDTSTLREALQSASRYVSLHTDSLQLSLKETDDLAMLEIERLSEEPQPSRQGTELAVGVFHGAIRQLLGNSPDRWRVWFSHSAPNNISGYRRVFGAQVEFGHSVTALLLARHDLDIPLPGADPVMARHVRHYLDPMLARSRGTVSERLRHFVYEQLSTGRCTAEQAASRLGMDRRTLHRHLGRSGETFSSIVDEVRSDLALRYLEEQRRSLNEVTPLLGFSAPSAFSRWFLGRFGCTPGAWRITDARLTEPTSPRRAPARNTSSTARALRSAVR
jgi:AraC-like DNA-binding protein